MVSHLWSTAFLGRVAAEDAHYITKEAPPCSPRCTAWYLLLYHHWMAQSPTACITVLVDMRMAYWVHNRDEASSWWLTLDQQEIAFTLQVCVYTNELRLFIHSLVFTTLTYISEYSFYLYESVLIVYKKVLFLLRGLTCHCTISTGGLAVMKCTWTKDYIAVHMYY